jgi:uncharacterized membrane protein
MSMSEDTNLTLEERISRLEQRLDEIAATAGGRDRPWPHRGAPSQPRRPHFRSSIQNPLTGRTLEWWLARGGGVLTSLAVVLLYQYAVERNWITPIVRIGMGTVVGAVLIAFASRIERASSDHSRDVVGLREVLFGAGLAAWYITAYAAAVFYGLISLSAARAIFIGLSIGGAWLALREHRSVLGFLTLGVGFLTPVLLPSTQPSIPVLALYLGALTAVGLVLYLMRGWQSIIWLTATAFWWTTGAATELVAGVTGFRHITGSILSARISMTLLIIAAGAALVRAPILRRRLVATGSPLYTSAGRSELGASIQEAVARRIEMFSRVKASPDSPALWVITIASPLLSVLFLSWVWTSVRGSMWGMASLGLAAFAYRLASSGSDEEFSHVEATAASLWSLAGLVWLADSVGNPLGQSSALMLGAAAAHSFAVLSYLKDSRFVAPQKTATATAIFCLLVVVMSETVFRNLALQGFDAAWTVAELGVIGTCLFIWRIRRNSDAQSALATSAGVGSYFALMLIDMRILGRVWPPLITASFAVAGAAFLICARGHPEARTLRRLGGVTLVIVFARLFMVDLARVETIWRVILFLGCGALFLFTSHRLQSPSSNTPAAPAG